MGKTFLINHQKNDKLTYDNIRNIAAGQEDGYTTGCLFILDYTYFKKYYKMIAQ